MKNGLACRNCERRSGVDRRALCRYCYADRDVRRRFPPSTTVAGKKEEWTPLGPLPPPCVAVPGSEEKIQILMERFENREQLFHPLDRCTEYE
jgi:hypothetical protein